MWTYFDFGTGTSKTLKVKSQEGGITGIYKGDFGLSVMGKPAGSQENVKLIISTVAEDTVLLSLDSLKISMSEGEVEPFSISAKASIKQEGDVYKRQEYNLCLHVFAAVSPIPGISTKMYRNFHDI